MAPRTRSAPISSPANGSNTSNNKPTSITSPKSKHASPRKRQRTPSPSLSPAPTLLASQSPSLSCSPSLSPAPSLPPTRTPPFLDATFFPHIMDLIFQHAPYPLLVSLRATCRLYRDMADTQLSRHLVLKGHGAPFASSGRMPALAPESGTDTLKQRLYPHTRVLEVGSESMCCSTPGSLGAHWFSNVEVVRTHTAQIPAELCSLTPSTFVYTASVMAKVVDRRRSIVVPPHQLPPSVSRVVLNLPWSASDISHFIDPNVFSDVADYTVIFVSKQQVAPESNQTQPNILKPLLCTYAIHLHALKKSADPAALALGGGGDWTEKHLTLVDLPCADQLYPRPKIDINTRRAHALNYLENKLVWFLANTGVAFSDAEINAILGKVSFVHRKDYKAAMERGQFLLETRVRARDCS